MLQLQLLLIRDELNKKLDNLEMCINVTKIKTSYGFLKYESD